MSEPEKKYNVITNEDLSDYLFNALIEFGVVPSEDEVDLIADLVFDYLFTNGTIMEEYDDEEDEPDPDNYDGFYYDNDDEEYGG